MGDRLHSAETLGRCYARFLEVAPGVPPARGLVERATKQYRDTGFARIEGMSPPGALETLAAILIPLFEPIADDVEIRHVPRGDGELSGGARFRRIDPECTASLKREKALTQLFEMLQIIDFGARLGAKVLPTLRRIAGSVVYRRIYFYLYQEGHYISMHNDAHVGNRVDVQWPLSIATSGGVRILQNGLLQMHYDVAGTMNVLGPRVWHDVPPIVRCHPDIAPLRLNMGMRFEPQQARATTMEG